MRLLRANKYLAECRAKADGQVLTRVEWENARHSPGRHAVGRLQKIPAKEKHNILLTAGYWDASSK